MQLKNLPVGQTGFVSRNEIDEVLPGGYRISKYAVCKPTPIGPFTIPVTAHVSPEGQRWHETFVYDIPYDENVPLIVVEQDDWLTDNFVPIALSIGCLVAAAVYLFLRNR